VSVPRQGKKKFPQKKKNPAAAGGPPGTSLAVATPGG